MVSLYRLCRPVTFAAASLVLAQTGWAQPTVPGPPTVPRPPGVPSAAGGLRSGGLRSGVLPLGQGSQRAPVPARRFDGGGLGGVPGADNATQSTNGTNATDATSGTGFSGRRR